MNALDPIMFPGVPFSGKSLVYMIDFNEYRTRHKIQLSVVAINSENQRFSPLHYVQLQEMKSVNPIWLQTVLLYQSYQTAR